ncbi:MAG: Ldh family oxidoreductase [Rhodobacteraceae bacterium]|nr:Ldh family oxidoreductase [Paracoccaceae bacterium]
MTTQTLTLEDAETLIADALIAAGTRDDTALSVARALVAAEAEGQVGHGFSRLSDYAAQVRSGKVDGQALPSLTNAGDAALVIDAGNGFAYPALDLAIPALAEAAQKIGCATAAIHNSHHCGALSVPMARVADQGLVGMMMANTPSAMAPWGAKQPFFGTNPIAFAAPRPGGDPLVIDLSLSRVARGKVMHAKKTGQTIPDGWALDADGQPTTNPDAALAGSMLPIGEAKGAALALIVEIFASAMTGANSSPEVGSFFSADGPPSGAGQFLMAFRPADPVGFAHRIDRLLTAIDAMEGTRLPGARRAASLARASSHGIDVPVEYVTEARAIVGARA